MKILKFKANKFFKSKMLKISLLIVSTISIASLVLTGCLGNNSNDSKNNKKTILTFWSSKIEVKEQLENLAKKFQEKNPDVQINIITHGGSGSYAEQFKASANAGNLPDFWNIASFGEYQQSKDHIKCLDDMPLVKKMDERWLGSVKGFDNKIYGVPECIEGYGFIINKLMFETVGIDTSSMYSWDGMVAAFEKLKQAISQKDANLLAKFPNISSVFLMPLGEAWVQGNHGFVPFINEDFYPENAPKDYNPIHEAFNAKELPGKGFKHYKTFMDVLYSYSQNNAMSQKYDDVVDNGLFMKSGAATQQGVWLASKIKQHEEQNKDGLSKELIMLPLNTPIAPQEKGKYVVSTGQYFVINKNVSDDKYKKIEKFLEFFFSPEMQDYYTNELCFISPMKGANQLFKDSSSFNETLKKAIKENNIISGDLSLIKTEEFSREGVGTFLQKYFATKDFSEQSFFKTVEEPSKRLWKEISKNQ